MYRFLSLIEPVDAQGNRLHVFERMQSRWLKRKWAFRMFDVELFHFPVTDVTTMDDKKYLSTKPQNFLYFFFSSVDTKRSPFRSIRWFGDVRFRNVLYRGQICAAGSQMHMWPESLIINFFLNRITTPLKERKKGSKWKLKIQ